MSRSIYDCSSHLFTKSSRQNEEVEDRKGDGIEEVDGIKSDDPKKEEEQQTNDVHCIHRQKDVKGGAMFSPSSSFRPCASARVSSQNQQKKDNSSIPSSNGQPSKKSNTVTATGLAVESPNCLIQSVRKINFVPCSSLSSSTTNGSCCKYISAGDQLPLSSENANNSNNNSNNNNSKQSYHEHLSLSTEFYLVGKLLCRTDDVFVDLDEPLLSQPKISPQSQQLQGRPEAAGVAPPTFQFLRRVRQGYLFEYIGMYLTFPEVSSGKLSATTPNSSSTMKLQSIDLKCDSSFHQTSDAIEIHTSLTPSIPFSFSSSSSSLCYKIELLQKQTKTEKQSSTSSEVVAAAVVTLSQSSQTDSILAAAEQKEEVRRREDQEYMENIRRTGDEETESLGTPNYYENYVRKTERKARQESMIRQNSKNSKNSKNNLNSKRRHHEISEKRNKYSASKLTQEEEEEQEDLRIQQEEEQEHHQGDEDDDDDDEFYSGQKSRTSQGGVGQQPLQPKKNVVKNFVKAFRNYVNISGDANVLMGCLNDTNVTNLREFRSMYKRHEAAHKFNNTFIKSLLTTEPFKGVFHHFVHHEAWEWLDRSSVNNKQAHKIVLNDYIKATQDLSRIESIYSLRSRNRQTSSSSSGSASKKSKHN